MLRRVVVRLPMIWALGLALALHAAALGSMLRSRDVEMRDHAAVSGPSDSSVIEIDSIDEADGADESRIDEAHAESPAEAPHESDAERAALRADAPSDAEAARYRKQAPRGELAPSGSGETSVPLVAAPELAASEVGISATAEGPWFLAPGREASGSQPRTDRPAGAQGIDLGLAPGAGWRMARSLGAGPSGAEPRRTGSTSAHAWAAPSSSTGGLQEALDTRDREIGLGKGGPVLSAAHTAARGEWAPLVGMAVFEITAEASGKVAVRVGRGGAEPAGAWNRVAEEMAAALRAKPPKIPEGARGMHFEVEVKAKLLHEPPPTKAEATLGEVEDKPGQPIQLKKLPGVYVSGGTRACQYQVAITPSLMPLSIAGGCEAPQKQARNVAARLLSESRF